MAPAYDDHFPVPRSAIDAFPSTGAAVPGAVPRAGGHLEGYLDWALRVVHEQPSELNTTFFGADNVELLQKRMATDVRRLTGHGIGRQSDQSLLAIMAAVYTNVDSLANVRGLSASATVDRLNNLVLRECVKQCVDGIAALSGYVADASTNAKPMPRPVNPSIKGGRVLPGTLMGQK